MPPNAVSNAEKRFTLAISKQVEEARSAAGLSRAQLAAEVGVSSQMMHNYITGAARWTPFRLRLIADVLAIPVQCFVPKKLM